MKLAELEVFLVKNPPPGYGGRYFIFVKLITDTGIVGYGEVYNASIGAFAMKTVIEDVFLRYVAGQKPHNIEAMGARVFASGFSHRPDPTIVSAWSGMEMALWDIVGKAANQPIYNLLGGSVNERVRTYTYLFPDDVFDADFYHDPVRSADKAEWCVKQGFSALKLDPAGAYTAFDPHQPNLNDIDRSVRVVSAIREAVGNHADILIGTHGQFTPSGAIRFAEALSALKPLWFEEPVPPSMPECMAEVARKTSIPIAAGERLTTRFEFARLLQSGAASILQMNSGRVGGILEARKIAAMAEPYYAQIAPHLYCGPLVAAANLQVSICTPNFLLMESIEKMDGFLGELVFNGLVWQDGCLLAPTEPGLGVCLNETLALEYALQENDALHLNMQAQPYSYQQ